jgi:hypothetical protein
LCGWTLGIEATTGLFYQPRMIGDGDCEEIGGMKIDRGNRNTRRKPAQRQFVHHKSHMTRPVLNPGHRGGKPATNRLSYGAAFGLVKIFLLSYSRIIDAFSIQTVAGIAQSTLATGCGVNLRGSIPGRGLDFKRPDGVSASYTMGTGGSTEKWIGK